MQAKVIPKSVRVVIKGGDIVIAAPNVVLIEADSHLIRLTLANGPEIMISTCQVQSFFVGRA